MMPAGYPSGRFGDRARTTRKYRALKQAAFASLYFTVYRHVPPLGLPLAARTSRLRREIAMSAMASGVWTSTDLGQSAVLARLPDEMELLLAHLTDHGKDLLEQEIAEAMRGPDSLLALTRVLSSWWYTLVARNEPEYFTAMSRPSPEPGEAKYESTEELKARLGV